MLILLALKSSEWHTGHSILRILSAGLILLNKKPHAPQRNHSLSVYAAPPSIIMVTPQTNALAIFCLALTYIRLSVGRDTPIETDASCWVFIS